MKSKNKSQDEVKDEVERILEGTKLLFKDKLQMKFIAQDDYFWESSSEYIVQKENGKHFFLK